MPINTAEGGTNGTTVTAANSGGLSQAPFDVVTITDATATLIYDTAHPATGALSYKFQLGSVVTEDYLQWVAQFSATNRKRVFFRYDCYWTGLPSAAIYQLRVANAAGTNTFGLKIDVAGKLAIFDGAGSLVSTMATAVPLNTLFHVEIELSVTGTSGAVVVRRWDLAGGNYDTVSGTVTAAVPVGRIRWGHTGTAIANVGPWWMDNLEVAFPDGVVTPPDTFLDNDLILEEDNATSPLGSMYQPWPEQTVDTGIAAQPLTPASIDGSAVAGQSTLAPGAVTLAPVGIDATGPVGQLTLTQTLAPAGIAAAGAVGQPTVTPVIAPAGIATAEIVGQAVLTPGTVTVSPAGIDGSSAAGQGSIGLALALTPISVPSGEVVGQSALTLTLAPAGIGSAEAVGIPAVTLRLAPNAIDGSATPGQATLAQAVAPVAVASVEAVGQSTLTPGAVTVSPAAIASGEQVGVSVVAALGAPLNPVSITSTETVGQATLAPGTATVSPASIATGQVVGYPTLTLTLAPASIDGSTAPGQATLAQALAPVGISSPQAVGVSTLVPGAVTISVGGIPSAERVGQTVLTAISAIPPDLYPLTGTFHTTNTATGRDLAATATSRGRGTSTGREMAGATAKES